MKIVFLNPAATMGGAERALLDFLTSLRMSDPAVDLHLVTGTAGPFLQEAKRIGVRTETLPLPQSLAQMGDSILGFGGGTRVGKTLGLAWRGMLAWPVARSYVKQLKSRLEQLAPDIIHSNGIKYHLLGARALPEGVPFVWHVHDFLSTRRFVSRLLRWASGRVAHAITNSQAVESDFHKLIPSIPAKTIYNGIDTDSFSPGPGDIQRLDLLAGMPKGSPEMVRVGLLATFARWKGQDVFLEAAAKLTQGGENRPIRFYIIGGPIYQTQGSQFTETELRNLAARFGVADRVGFIPFQSDTASIYRALDVVVHASTKPEPFGLTIVQAMACGRAVVAMQAGGAAELFTHDVDAVGAPPNDPGALCAAIRRLTDDPALRARLGEYAHKSAVARFSRSRLGPELLAVYGRLLEPIQRKVEVPFGS